MNNNTTFNQIFLRFLKMNNIYHSFMFKHKQLCNRCGKKMIDFNGESSICKQIKHFHLLTPRDIFLNGFLISWSYGEQDIWTDIDKKWYNFYYKHRLYTKYVKNIK